MDDTKFWSNNFSEEIQAEILSLIEFAINNAWSNLLDAIPRTKPCCVPAFGYQGNVPPDYNNPMNQHLYVLKYFPAYLYEYTKMYQQVFRRAIKRKIERLNVLSFGCGCGLDFYGLYFARKICDITHIPVCYRGVDVVEWEYRGLIPNDDNLRFQISNHDITTIPSNDLKQYNIFIFPKSLSEFPDVALKSLCSNIRQSTFPSPFILAASTMTIAYTDDECRIKSLIEAFGQKRDMLVPCCRTGQEIGICCDWSFWDYPKEIITNLKNINDFCSAFSACLHSQNCMNTPEAQRARTPILTQKFVRYYIETFL